MPLVQTQVVSPFPSGSGKPEWFFGLFDLVQRLDMRAKLNEFIFRLVQAEKVVATVATLLSPAAASAISTLAIDWKEHPWLWLQILPGKNARVWDTRRATSQQQVETLKHLLTEVAANGEITRAPASLSPADPVDLNDSPDREIQHPPARDAIPGAIITSCSAGGLAQALPLLRKFTAKVEAYAFMQSEADTLLDPRNLGLPEKPPTAETVAFFARAHHASRDGRRASFFD